MLDELRKIKVFVVRDFRMLSTYKLALSMTFLTTVFNLFYFALFGSMFGSSSLPALSDYGGDFLSYIIIGSMGWGFLWSIMGTTAASLRSEMMMGTVESILLTKTRLYTMMVSYAIYGSFFGLISIVILLSVGYLVFGLEVFANANLFTLVVFFLSATMMMGFGLIFGGITIWLKNIGPTTMLLQNISMFFCGVYFPLTVLPVVARPISYYIPFYYSIEGLRRSLIPSTTTGEMMMYSIILLFCSVLFNAIGLYVLHRGLIKAKKDGSLMFY